MRCLYCNKKLSLLKLAKGDSFCSPEHFDAHQLKLSNDAFQRLMSLPAEDAPRAPLVLKPKDEIPREAAKPNLAPQEQDAALARLFGASEAPPPKAPAAKTKQGIPPPANPPLASPPAAKVPPYAPFARAPLPSWPPGPAAPISNGPEADEATPPAHELAFPVHDVETTVCILNLYLRVSLAGTKPANWTSERYLVVTPEYFNLQIIRPPSGLSTDFRQIESPATVDTPRAPELPVEPAAVKPVPAKRAPAEPASVDQPSIEPAVVASAAPVPEELKVPEVSPAVAPVSNPRVPFLVAPSFQERTGAPLVVHSAANAAPRSSVPAPARDMGKLPRLDSRGTIAQFTSFVGGTGPQPRSSAVPRMKSDAQRPVQPCFVLPPVRGQICHDGWRPSNQHIGIGKSAMNWSGIPPQTSECNLPSPDLLLVRPNAALLRKVDPKQLLAGSYPIDTVSLLPGVVEASPQGREASVADPLACAMEFGWRAALGHFPEDKPRPAAWQYQTSYFSRPNKVADKAEKPMAALDSLSCASSCTKTTHIDDVVLPPIFVVKNWYHPGAWLQSDSPSARVVAEYGIVFKGSTMLPSSAELRAGGFKADGGPPILAWEPFCPAPESVQTVKFLPARQGAALPEAQNWPRLELLPR
jgi:hypothetical protein